MAHYAQWGDTGQWDKSGSLFHNDAVIIIDARPRPDPEADPRIEAHTAPKVGLGAHGQAPIWALARHVLPQPQWRNG